MPEIEYPISVNKIEFEGKLGVQSPVLFKDRQGKLVAVRSCRKEHGEKTYLGVYIGDIPLSAGVSWDKESGTLKFRTAMENPAIFIPELRCVVMGAESFWRVIESAEQLKKITDEDINNVWYIQALKQIAATEQPAEAASETN